MTATIGSFLKTHRESLALKQKDVADAVGVSSAYLNKVEKGDSIPSPACLEKLADALHLDFIDLYLFSLEEKKLPDTLMAALREYRALRPLLAPGMPVARFRTLIRSLNPDQVKRLLLIIESVTWMIHEAAHPTDETPPDRASPPFHTGSDGATGPRHRRRNGPEEPPRDEHGGPAVPRPYRESNGEDPVDLR